MTQKGLTRRYFLKMCAVGAGMLTIPVFRLEESDAYSGDWFGAVRELCAYDIWRDDYLLRWDVFVPKLNNIYSCGAKFEEGHPIPREDFIERYRKPVAAALRGKLIGMGVKPSDFGKLETPEWLYGNVEKLII